MGKAPIGVVAFEQFVVAFEEIHSVRMLETRCRNTPIDVAAGPRRTDTSAEHVQQVWSSKEAGRAELCRRSHEQTSF
jgi:hypothetical protein